MTEPQHNISGWSDLAPLAERPDAKVLIVQGFEEYEVASRLITGMVTLTWSGEVEDLPLVPLRGRKVTIWPNWKAPILVPRCGDLAQALLPMAETVEMVQPKGGTDGCNVADFAQQPGIKAAMYARERLVPVRPALAHDEEPQEPAQAMVATRPGRPALTVVEGGGAMRKLAPKPDQKLPPAYSEDALALAFGEQHQDNYRHVAAWGKWLKWDGRRWASEETLEAMDLAREVGRTFGLRAMTDPELSASKQVSIAYKMGEARTVGAIERMARADRRLAIEGDVFDKDPWTLNTPSGLVDLRDGIVRPARPDDYLTKMTRVGAQGGTCPTWLRFLEQATCGDAELQGFLQVMAGYCLTGSTREHALFFVHGPGGAGKGTFVNTLQWILGDYSAVASMETFTESRNERHSTELAMLRGARMVTAQETEEGRRWAESRLKALTGGDPITARFMRMDNFTFVPQFKLVIAGNHRPGLRNVDEAIRRRMNLIPFTAKVDPAERDNNLPDKLRAEAEGILAWAIEGCTKWQRSGIRQSERVSEATGEYLETEDTIGTWLEECCVRGDACRAKRSDLYASYKAWAEANGEFAVPLKRWVPQMDSRGLEAKKSSGVPTVIGLGILPGMGAADFARAAGRRVE